MMKAPNLGDTNWWPSLGDVPAVEGVARMGSLDLLDLAADEHLTCA